MGFSREIKFRGCFHPPERMIKKISISGNLQWHRRHWPFSDKRRRQKVSSAWGENDEFPLSEVASSAHSIKCGANVIYNSISSITLAINGNCRKFVIIKSSEGKWKNLSLGSKRIAIRKFLHFHINIARNECFSNGNHFYDVNEISMLASMMAPKNERKVFMSAY